jgi:ABC-type phosphate/phosphonate transport system substrate-binding protein
MNRSQCGGWRVWIPAFVAAAVLAIPVQALAAEVLNVGLIPSEDPRVVIADDQVFIDALASRLKTPRISISTIRASRSARSVEGSRRHNIGSSAASRSARPR